jgi:CHAT domain-containing protein/Tfp pilus assembly protein PilF
MALCLDNLADNYARQARYPEAVAAYQQALAIKEKVLGPEHSDVAMCLCDLALAYTHQGRHAEAEALLKRALDIEEKVHGPYHARVATDLNNLANLYFEQGRYTEAEALLKQALGIDRKVHGPEHPHLAYRLNNLATLYTQQGRYAEAEPYHKQALAIREKALGEGHPDVGVSCRGLAYTYSAENRDAEAEPFFRRALTIQEKTLGSDHPELALVLYGLANVYRREGRYVEAESLCRRALGIYRKKFGDEHPCVAMGLSYLARLYAKQDRFDEAEPLYKQALAIAEKTRGPEHPDTARTLYDLALLYYRQKRYRDAEPLLDRAVFAKERAGTDPGDRSNAYLLRARVAWESGRRTEATADLREAMQLAEERRTHSAGAEQERAESFGRFGEVFEQMLAWQAELGDVNEALGAVERGRARSLLDELSSAGANLQAGRPAIEREQARRREFELKQRVAALEKQIDKLQPADAQEKQRLGAALADARNELYEHYRDERSSSPVYRNLLSAAAGPPRLSQIQRRLLSEHSLLLVYFLGEKGGYVIAVGPSDAALAKLAVDETAAKTLGIDAGPLTADRLRRALVDAAGTGVLERLKTPKQVPETAQRLAALFEALIPEPQRKALADGSIKRLIVVPDGQLALLPFETLVAVPADGKCLLDVGPPISYAPSATVLYNLAERRAAPVAAGRESVLTVGNPNYSPGVRLADARTGVHDELTSRSRYGALGGKLSQLPFSGWEAEWVAGVFGRNDIKATRLDGTKATEAAVRSQAPGHRVVHFACHGLADQSFGNFFGALALSPGKNPDNPADDGFLTLAEIYELDLKNCELAILSACETNFGPEQRGEGVWALSRGFLVAGARRVVASNWLVDDEAAASLVSYYCSILAKAEKDGRPPDYAEALQKAKRWVRQQEKWNSPYYWSTFVLMGPG